MYLNNIKDTKKISAKARQKLISELPIMFGFVGIMYFALGLGISKKIGGSNAIIIEAGIRSLIFGILSGLILLVIGTIILKYYAQAKIRSAGFQSASSVILVTAFRVGGFCGLPISFWSVFKIIIPFVEVTQSTNVDVQNWIAVLIIGAILIGWFAGRAIGGLIGLRTIYFCGLPNNKR